MLQDHFGWCKYYGKGTMTGVISDMDGNFEITALIQGASLIFLISVINLRRYR